jgi:prepilin-type N-terminal cleavage/methylation domain-containing protein
MGEQCKSSRRKAFTLIELLIVVAIIAILAAIAVPNFLEAQVRSKVSRVKSDLRSAATALEAYVVDHGRYPDIEGEPYGYLQYIYMLSTPVAYITSTMLRDPFVPQPSIFASSSLYSEWNATYWYVTFEGQWGRSCLPEAYHRKAYCVHSYGPDRIQGLEYQSSDVYRQGMARFPYSYEYLHDEVTAWNMIYDATNGTKSLGDVGRFGGDLNCPLTPGW